MDKNVRDEHDVMVSSTHPTLIDVLEIFLKNKVLLLAVFLVIFLIALGKLYFEPDQYKVAMVVEIGSYVVPGNDMTWGERKYVEPTQQSKIKLDKRFVVQAIQDRKNDHPEVPMYPIRVRAPDNANILEVFSQQESQFLEKEIDMFAAIAESFLQDHERRLEDVREEIYKIVEGQHLKVKTLLSKVRKLQIARDSFVAMKAALASREVMLKSQIQELNKSIETLTDIKDEQLNDASNRRGDFTYMFVADELSSSLVRRDELQHALVVEMENLKIEYGKQVKEIDERVDVAQTELRAARSRLRRMYIEGAYADDEVFSATGLKLNIQPTSVVVKPHASSNAVGLGIVVSSVLALIGSAFLALFIVLFYDLILRAQNRTNMI